MGETMAAVRAQDAPSVRLCCHRSPMANPSLSPPSALHPTIQPHVPLTFDIVDRWSERSIGGCRYHVSHPGGRSFETFPVNAFEAEGRRLARFESGGHSPGRLTPRVAVHPEFPLTLDLRRAS